MRVLVSGIGRSATTMVYQQIAQLARDAFSATQFRYEPYLWYMNKPVARGSQFGMADLSIDGIYAHKNTPLFLDGPHDIHDQFLDELFLPGNRDGDPANPDAYITKVIRGSGRLRSYIQRFPDIKIVACVRNPIDTINSSMGFFSLLGEEFHSSDRARLSEELRTRNLDRLELSVEDSTHLVYAQAWWQSFTEAVLQIEKEFPTNVHLMVAERFNVDRNGEIRKLIDFLGFGREAVFRAGLKTSAGRKINARYLLANDLKELWSSFEFYLNDVLSNHGFDDADRTEFTESILNKYAQGGFSKPVAAAPTGQRSPIQLRDQIFKGVAPPDAFTLPKSTDPSRIAIDEVAQVPSVEKITDAVADRKFGPDVLRSVSTNISVGCCITAFNNENTIQDTLFSVLDQSRPFDEVVVVNDASTDQTGKILDELAGRYSTVRVFHKRDNGGVSGARNFGLSAMNTTHATHIDGDDCFWPSKNREEYEVLADTPDAIAFSRILNYETDGAIKLLENGHYSGPSTYVYELMMKRLRGIPRDMTMKKIFHQSIGGYDTRLDLYEDWDFKTRLCLDRRRLDWRMSDAYAGTIYNRKAPGLSKSTNLRHWRRITQLFLKNLDLTITSPPFSSKSYDNAVSSFNTPHKECVHELLVAVEMGAIPNTVFKRLLDRFAWVCSDGIFLRLIDSLVSDYGAHLPDSRELPVYGDPNIRIYGFHRGKDFEQAQIKIDAYARDDVRLCKQIIQLQDISGTYYLKIRRRNVPFFDQDERVGAKTVDETGDVFLAPLPTIKDKFIRNERQRLSRQFVDDIWGAIVRRENVSFLSEADEAFVTRARYSST